MGSDANTCNTWHPSTKSQQNLRTRGRISSNFFVRSKRCFQTPKSRPAGRRKWGCELWNSQVDDDKGGRIIPCPYAWMCGGIRSYIYIYTYIFQSKSNVTIPYMERLGRCLISLLQSKNMACSSHSLRRLCSYFGIGGWSCNLISRYSNT